MTYHIDYAYTCHAGKVRPNNEDNFWCCGESLDSENKGMSHVCSGHIKQADLPLLAVFDGMGGESCGEMAAFLAAESCGQYYKEKKKEFSEDPEQFMNGLCSTMNHAVCHYGKENKINSMGTTAAMLAFGKENVYSCNLGDSRIYQISSEGKLGQLSLDHVLGGGRFGKPPLTQYLGIPEESMGLEPTIVSQKAEIGTRYLICSDGITDMLSDGEIADILTREISVSETVELLVERALIKGGRDNITVILCELVEQEKSLFGKLLNYFL